MQSHLKRAARSVCVVGAVLEGIVLVGAILWALRPDGDIGNCTDVCVGDRSVEAIFGGVVFAVLVAFGVAGTLVGMLVGRVAWRAAVEASRPMPARWVWASGMVGLALAGLCVVAVV